MRAIESMGPGMRSAVEAQPGGADRDAAMARGAAHAGRRISRLADRLGAVANPQLGQNRRDMELDRALADPQFGGDLFVLTTLRQLSQHLQLTLGELLGQRRRAAELPQQPRRQLPRDILQRPLSSTHSGWLSMRAARETTVEVAPQEWRSASENDRALWRWRASRSPLLRWR